MRQGVLASTSVNFPYGRENFHHFPSTYRVACRLTVNFRELSVPSGDLPLTSFNILYDREKFRRLSLTFCAVGKPSINFHQHSGWPRDLLSTSVNILFDRETFRQLSVLPEDLPLISVDYLCCRETFHELLSTFCAAKNVPSNFLADWRHSDNFRPHFMYLGDLLLTFIKLPY